MIYVFLSFFSITCIPFLLLRQKETLYFLSYILLILIIFFMGTRYGVGNDYFGLMDLYEGYINKFEIRFREPLFYFFAEIDLLFEANGSLLVFTYSLITWSLIFFASNSYKIRLYSIIYFLLSGFIFYSNDQVRQALGFSIIYFIMMKALAEKNTNSLKFDLQVFFSFLLAGIAHFSFLFLGFVYLLSMIAKKFYRLSMVLPLLSFAIFFNVDINVSEVVHEISPLIIVDRFLFSERFLNPEFTNFPNSILIFIIIFYIQLFLLPDHNGGIRSVLVYISISFSMYILFFETYLVKRLFSDSIYLISIPILYNIKYYYNNLKFKVSIVVTLTLLMIIFYGYINSSGGRHGGIPYNSIFLDGQ